MSARRRIDDATMKVGLLMESAQAHQKLAETHLEKLRAHTQDLDGVVREEIRRTLIEELQDLAAESKRAAQALNGMKRAANMRGAALERRNRRVVYGDSKRHCALGASLGERSRRDCKPSAIGLP